MGYFYESIFVGVNCFYVNKIASFPLHKNLLCEEMRLTAYVITPVSV